jgi:uncharacterized protein YndB with AHSA1/START domain
MTDAMEPIRKSVFVRCDVERAFDLYTQGTDTWWPLETHTRHDEIEGATVERVEFPTEPGGQILEHLSTGTALAWGELLASERPHRVVIAWKPNSSANPPTEVEVTFTAEGGGTRVELEHRGWERLGALAEEGRADYDEGWDFVLGRYVEAAVA